MLNPTLHRALNDHLGAELYSAHLYLSMSAYCESMNLPGFARWMRAQSEEERDHAMKFYEFIGDRGSRVVLGAIEQPPTDFASPLDLFEQALAHEQQVTAMIHRLYGLAEQEKDYPSQTFLQWFVIEQVEEEKTATGIVETLRTIGENRVAVLMLDRELGGRGAEA